jgi:hypothetical protein
MLATEEKRRLKSYPYTENASFYVWPWAMSALMTPQKLPGFLRKRLNPIGTDMVKERGMGDAFRQGPEFHINAVRTLLERVDRCILAFDST